MATALLIIDVQHALCSGEYAAFEIERVIDRINLVSQHVRERGGLVVVVQHQSNHGPLVRSSEGWKLAGDLLTSQTDIVLSKAASDAFHNTELQNLLQSRGVTKLIVCGLQSEFCVDTTVRRALALGYPVTLVADGHSTVANGTLTALQISAHHNETLANLSSFGPRAIPILASEVRVEA
jgi:nicotinamidase-related amidase